MSKRQGLEKMKSGLLGLQQFLSPGMAEQTPLKTPLKADEAGQEATVVLFKELK